jgi:hypothetical protein
MALNGGMVSAPRFENDAKGSDRDLILDTILEFFWRNEINQAKF